MISLLRKLYCSYWNRNNNADEADVPDDPTLTLGFVNIDDTSTHERTGVVTSLCPEHSYGLIDRAIYFKFDVVVGNEQLKIGDQVIVSANRRDIHEGFIATSVAVQTNWDACSAHSNSNDKSVRSLLLENFDSEDIKEIDGHVTDMLGEFGILDEKFRFFMADVDTKLEILFRPHIGDRITGSLVSFNSEERLMAWKPKLIKTINGKLSFFEIDRGEINDNIFFDVKSCYCDFPLVPGMKLQAAIVENKHWLNCAWRAFSLALYSEDEEWLDKPIMEESVDLCICGNSNFLDMTIGDTKCIDFIVKNNQNTSVDLFSVRFKKLVGKSPFIVGDISTKCIPANSEAVIKVSCKATNVGKDSDILICEFDEFLLTRELRVNIVDPAQSLLNVTAPYERHRKQRSREDLGSKIIIPGEKVFNPRANFKGHAPSFMVPHKLRTAIENHKNFLDIAPVLFEKLYERNYCRRFDTLLHLEEIQMGVHMLRFSMSEVVLQRQRLFLVLEVPGLAEGRPSLMIGDKAMLYPPDESSNLVYEGYIHEVRRNDIFLKFHSEFQAGYNGETYNVSFEFNRSNLKNCHQCLHHVYNSSRHLLFPTFIPRKRALIKVFAGRGRSSYSLQNGRDIEWRNLLLNSQQKNAIQRILEAQCRPLPYLIFGPPGTGKTVTLVEAVVQIYLAFENARILICAPTNSAADLFTQRLLDSKVFGNNNLIRLNSYQRAVESIPEFIRPYCQDKDSVMKVIHYPVIISTSSTASVFYGTDMLPNHFTHVFIDEACQLIEPETMVAIGVISTHTNGSLIMAGDPKQLGAVVQSSYAKDCGLDISYMERLMQDPLYMRNETEFKNFNGYNPQVVTMLVDCYRMHPAILNYPSVAFYNSELRCCVPEERHNILKTLNILPAQGFPIIFHGVQGSEEREESSPSWFNSVEIVQVTNYLRQLYAHGINPRDVGIITPYRKQVEKLRLFIDALKLDRCKVGSVEEFQGQERRAIIISTVRSHENYMQDDITHHLGFLRSPKRFNVAITRAEELLIIVGNPSVLSHDDNWDTFIRYCQANGGYAGWSPLTSND